MATRKDKAEADAPQAEEPQVTLEQAGPVVPTFVDGVGEVDEKVNPAQDELQERVDTAEERGFLGVKVDDTPNEHYTVGGVTAGLPTPETNR